VGLADIRQVVMIECCVVCVMPKRYFPTILVYCQHRRENDTKKVLLPLFCRPRSVSVLMMKRRTGWCLVNQTRTRKIGFGIKSCLWF